MEEKDLTPHDAEVTSPQEETPVKSQWQQTKEGWYDKIPLTVKQLDWIIGLALAGLVITFIVIFLDAAGVF